MGERIKRYLYSVVMSTFFFVLLRELGWIGQAKYYYGPPQQQQQEPPSSSIPGGLRTVDVVQVEDSHATIPLADNTPIAQEQPHTITTNNNINDINDNAIINTTTTDSTVSDQGTVVKKPIMYTFFEWIPKEKKGTQMSDDADRALIAEWMAAWGAFGWEPRVLSLEHAKQHKDFESYSQQLTNIPMMGIDGQGGNIVYNQLCFLRWLAMAAVGGGFMSDYDVFPLSEAPHSIEPPYHGNFTVYSVVKGSGTAGIPCLMSGRSDEWTRMAYAILANGMNHSKTETMWSDMFALIDMRKEEAYAAQDAVVEGQDVLLHHGWTREDCNLTASKKAVHFSHEALRTGYTEPGETTEERPAIVRRFLTRWYRVCVEGKDPL